MNRIVFCYNKERSFLKVLSSFVLFFFVIIYFGQEKIDIIQPKNLVQKNIFFYKIESDLIISEKILRIELFPSIPSYNNNQKLISYDYCKTLEECDRNFEIIKNCEKTFNHYEMTGYIAKNDSLWIHPPRSNDFRILELNAFPFYMNNKKRWQYSLTFGDYWSDKKWKEWKGNRTSITEYKVGSKPFFFKLGENKIKCYKIRAYTAIGNLGRTSSIFYYNEQYGFVHMIFKTINNKTIELRLIKSINDSYTN